MSLSDKIVYATHDDKEAGIGYYPAKDVREAIKELKKAIHENNPDYIGSNEMIIDEIFGDKLI